LRAQFAFVSGTSRINNPEGDDDTLCILNCYREIAEQIAIDGGCPPADGGTWPVSDHSHEKKIRTSGKKVTLRERQERYRN